MAVEKTDRRCKDIDPVEILPGKIGHRMLYSAAQEFGMGELLRHHAPERKQALLEAFQEQAQPDDDEQESHDDLAAVRHPFADDKPLKREQKDDNRQHDQRAVGDENQCVDSQIHQTTMP